MRATQLKPAVILVAERTLSADYKILFEGIFATMQTRQVPEIAMKRFLSPAARLDDQGRAVTAALGLRRVESALLRDGRFSSADVVCTTPEGLRRLMGPWVKVVLFSSSDPLGMGMSNTTTTNFWKGELYTSFWTSKLLNYLKDQKSRYDFKVVAGGAGAWQFSADPQRRGRLGVDVVYEGYFESAGPALIEKIVNGADVDDYVEQDTCAGDISPIAGPSMLGVIEISRGCGKGCGFCTMSAKKMRHLEPDLIIEDLQTNCRAGISSVVSSSEDFFRYGGKGVRTNFDALGGLLERMRQVPGLGFMQIDHGNVSSVLQFSDAELSEIRRLLSWSSPTDYLWVNMGVESANGELVKENCPGKIAPLDAQNWSEHVLEAADKMARCGFFCVFSVILGLPGETIEDVVATRLLVERLGAMGAVVFPIFHEPVGGAGQGNGRFTLARMTAEHLDLYRTCYEINFKGIPSLFWDNQRAGGVSFGKRAMLRVLGKTEIYSWRKAFKNVGRTIAAANGVG